MTVYVVVPIKDGLFGEVTVFLSRAGARTAEHRWLRRANIHDNKERERLAVAAQASRFWNVQSNPEFQL